MHVLNFGRPLSRRQYHALASLAEGEPLSVVDVPTWAPPDVVVERAIARHDSAYVIPPRTVRRRRAVVAAMHRWPRQTIALTWYGGMYVAVSPDGLPCTIAG